MSPEDTALCQQAIKAANAGQKDAAYQQFYLIYQHGNANDVTLLYWLAFTTPDPHECLRAISDIERVDHRHPKLPELRAYYDRKWTFPRRPIPSAIPTGPILSCPYCRITSPATVKYKVSIGSGLWFAAFFVVAIALWSAPEYTATAAQGAAFGGFFFLGVGIVGLFLFRKRTYSCGACGIALGDA